MGQFDWRIIWWALACTFLSFSTFILNEVTDRKDTDRYSWNPVHAHHNDVLNMTIVWSLFWVCAFIGFFLAALVGLFWWAVVVFLAGVLYSLEPIRFKRRIVLDILAQLTSWWIVPVMAPAWGVVDTMSLIYFVVATSFLVMTILFVYQVADFAADKKAGFHNTHVSLGLSKSLWLGGNMGILGIVLYFVFGFGSTAPWALPLVALTAAGVWGFASWGDLTSEGARTAAMQRFVGVAKPISRLFVPYLFVIWLW